MICQHLNTYFTTHLLGEIFNANSKYLQPNSDLNFTQVKYKILHIEI